MDTHRTNCSAVMFKRKQGASLNCGLVGWNVTCCFWKSYPVHGIHMRFMLVTESVGHPFVSLTVHNQVQIHYFIFYCCNKPKNCHLDSSVLKTAQADSGDHQSSCSLGTGALSSGLKRSGRGDAHSHLVPRLEMSGDVPPLTLMPSKFAQDNFTFHF